MFSRKSSLIFQLLSMQDTEDTQETELFLDE